MMNRWFYAIFIWGVLVLGSCRDSFDIDGLHEQARLVVGCLPSQADTTWISVTRSVPVSGDGRMEGTDLTVGDATVVYKVNGQPHDVQRSGGRHFVVVAHRPGDLVGIDVAAQGYAPVHASTVVPASVPVELQSITATRVYDTYYEESVDVYQLAATFTDPAPTRDYYAVRVRLRHCRATAIGDLRPDAPNREYYDNDYDRHVEWPVNDMETYRYLVEDYADDYDFHLRTDTVYTFPEVITAGEPLLQPLSEVDGDFGFENEFYQQFYIFSDELIGGTACTLHLCINRNRGWLSGYQAVQAEFQVLLYHITPEFYRFVKSVNDIDNNELAQGGFSMLSPTYTNVAGGIGIVGGYAMAESNVLTLDTQHK